jgi:hypothetical protein
VNNFTKISQQNAGPLNEVSRNVILLSLIFGLLTGCQHSPDARSLSQTTAAVSLQGSVYGGQKPVSGASVQLYAAGRDGLGSEALPLLNNPVLTDGTGNFSVRGLDACPSPDSQVFVVSRGGNPGLSSTGTNSNIALMTMLGSCNSLSASTFVTVNEITTVGSIWPVAGYMRSAINIGSTAGDASFGSAVSNVNQFVDITRGSSPGTAASDSYFADSPTLHSLADILATCVNSNGGAAGDGSPCGNLFSLAKSSLGSAPTDTLSAAMNIAQNPSKNTAEIFYLAPPTPTFQPTLQSTPRDWSLTLKKLITSPEISPAAGTYLVGQQISLTEKTASAVIHYTTDGSVPAISSSTYTEPITLSSNQTVKAIAILGTSASSISSASFSVRTEQLAFAALPNSVIADLPIHSALVVRVVDGAGNLISTATNPITLSLGGTSGTTSLTGTTTVKAVGGLATFTDLSVVGPSSAVTLAASSPGLKTVVSTAFQVDLPAPTMAISLSSPTVNVGSTLTGTIVLSAPATSNLAMSLSSGSPNLVSVLPSALTIPIGQSAVSFTYTAASAGLSTITAKATGYNSISATVTALPSLVPADYFGLSVLKLAVSPSLPLGISRSWDSTPSVDWIHSNPARGKFDFTGMDTFIAVNQSRGSEMIQTLGLTPPWASSQPTTPGMYGPGQCAPPTNIADWDNYVRAFAIHAAGRIKYWELWNEPNNVKFYCGDVATMVTMAQHAHDIIKSIDPSALILSPPVTGYTGAPWLNTFLSKGGGSYIDVVSIHGYWLGTAETLTTIASTYRTLMASHGISKLPLWDTEASWAGGAVAPNLQQQAAFLSKYFLLHWSLGMPHFIWYAYDSGTTWGQLWNANTGKNIAATAYEETHRWMVGAALTSACVSDKAYLWTCKFSRQKYEAEALWNSTKTVSVIVPSQFVEYRDLLGNVHSIVGHTVTVGNDPILVDTGPLPD